jgi:hypothetical protein
MLRHTSSVLFSPKPGLTAAHEGEREATTHVALSFRSQGGLATPAANPRFDQPVLRRAFPEWEPPKCHVDLRHLLARLGHDGGLKRIECRLPMLGLARPAHLDGVDGWGAGWLYRRGRDGDRDAMRAFAEYNLYDAINLRTLMAYAFNEMVEVATADAPALRVATRTLHVPMRGDVLYDMSKLLLLI